MRETRQLEARSRSSTTRRRRPSRSRSRGVPTRATGTTIRSLQRVRERQPFRDRVLQLRNGRRGWICNRVLHRQCRKRRERRCRSELRLERPVHRQCHLRPATRQQRLVQPSAARDVPRQRRWLRAHFVQRFGVCGPGHGQYHGQRNLHGQCGNRAGGTSPAFKYDSTPPTISNVGFDWDDGTATLTWTPSADTKAIEIDRTPGRPARTRRRSSRASPQASRTRA